MNDLSEPLPSEGDNPYRAPNVEAAMPIPAVTDAERIRRQHLNHEASVKAIGGLYLLFAVVWFIGMAGGLTAWLTAPAPPNQAMPIFAGTFTVLSLALAATLTFAGVGLRLLRPWGMWAAAMLSLVSIVLGLFLGNVIGIVLSAYVLYLLFCNKGQTVFSPEYQQVIRETRHVRLKTSIVTWIVLVLFVLAVIGFLGYAFAIRSV